ncbi:1-hydroxycarotenoid 3,4-desaturase CrtD [Mucilaginibacter sp.]
MPQPKALIIGAGIAGIATAIRLAVKGYNVDVFEVNSYPGGKLSEFEQQGYRFDAGPSLFTMPQYVDELFRLAGKNPADAFTYQRLDPVCNYFYADGSRFTAYADEDKFAAEAEAVLQQPAGQVRRYFQKSKAIYQITNHVFLEQSLHRLKTFLSKRTLRSVLRLPQIDALRTMHSANQKELSSKRIVQFFNRYATYNGSDPYQAPATLNVIPHLEQHFGAYFPDKGMYSITTSLVKLAEELGVTFHYGQPVQQIITAGNKATALQVNNNFIKADVIVSNMDVWFTYRKLLSKRPELFPEKILNQQRSSSALIFYWGISRQFAELDLHNIFFSGDYEAEFNHIWKQKNISSDPTIYLNISSKFKPDDAPPGHENWFVMINVPANTGQDWNTLIAKARQDIINKLSGQSGQDIASLITCESILDPRSIESRTSSYQGALYGTSSNNRFAAFLRHANRSSKLKNLYFCGGSVHPGGGIPLALLSAKIVSDWIGD